VGEAWRAVEVLVDVEVVPDDVEVLAVAPAELAVPGIV
jgi:hypothetical protein